MDTLPLLIILGTGCAVFAILMMSATRKRRDRVSPKTGRAAEVAVAGLASINFAGVFGLGWAAASMLVHDGFMVVELAICAGLISVLVMITAGGVALERRGKPRSAAALLAVAALPTIAAYGFLLYLDSHPIDMR